MLFWTWTFQSSSNIVRNRLLKTFPFQNFSFFLQILLVDNYCMPWALPLPLQMINSCDSSIIVPTAHHTHTYIPYQSFFMNWTYPKFKFFFFGVTVEKICPKNGDSMQIFNLRLIQNDGSTIVLCKHQKTLLLQLQSYAISYYFALFFRQNVPYYNSTTYFYVCTFRLDSSVNFYVH